MSVTIICTGCGASVEKRRADINRAERLGYQLFCNTQCSSHLGRRTNRAEVISRQCPGCGKLFAVTAKTRSCQLCSPECRAQSSKERANLQQEAAYNDFVARWLRGEGVHTIRGNNGGTSNYIRRYLFRKHNSSCSKCGWSEVNPATGRIPLHIEHLDGDWGNNVESNLTLLCPNCHSLTPTYGSLNKGHGRPRHGR